MERRVPCPDSPRPAAGEHGFKPSSIWLWEEKTLHIPNLLFLAGVILLGSPWDKYTNVLMYQLNFGEFGQYCSKSLRSFISTLCTEEMEYLICSAAPQTLARAELIALSTAPLSCLCPLLWAQALG